MVLSDLKKNPASEIAEDKISCDFENPFEALSFFGGGGGFLQRHS